MSNAVSALQGKSAVGFATVTEAGLQGMITLRGDLKSAKLKKAVKSAAGVDVPAARRITLKSGRGAGWMSPDELLILVPYAEARATVEALSKALADDHHLVADVSDARAMFRIKGDKADQVLAKLCPVDLKTLADGELRRTRAAQVAAALWQSDKGEFTLVSFRSVADYVFGALELSARSGSELSAS
ncbi:sarcosine oxidase subunit gamma [Frigidibacter sp. RF13]|uniref:sarcosine oxidase subunit gamma n=1 Tax=Frigidibacter sp. RF13 TaxID=2997340 RepID=UPI002271D100|nr:sarcosine oxidase subunit gamma family protein [Frigidibacter sp. RF13]MCY1127096.1 sarcosine oxidase subunit gamma [Frigidibacter sp. RF13]